MAEGSWSVAVMCYNEAPTLTEVVTRTLEVVGSLADDYEVIIVDDGSTDGSAELADELARTNTNVQVVHHEVNKGIGEVLRTAYRVADKDLISIVPGDLEFDPKDLRSGYHLVEEHTVVAYSIIKLPPLRRRLVTFLQSLLNSILFGLKVSRVNWVKIVHAGPLRQMDLISRSPVIETEVLVRLQRRGYRIVEVPSNNEMRLDRGGGLTVRAYAVAIWASLLETFVLWRALARESSARGSER